MILLLLVVVQVMVGVVVLIFKSLIKILLFLEVLFQLVIVLVGLIISHIMNVNLMKSWLLSLEDMDLLELMKNSLVYINLHLVLDY